LNGEALGTHDGKDDNSPEDGFSLTLGALEMLGLGETVTDTSRAAQMQLDRQILGDSPSQSATLNVRFRSEHEESM
jgi:hypothetical protein